VLLLFLEQSLIIGGIWLASKGKELTGLAFLIPPVAALVGAFFYTKSKRGREPDEPKNTHIEEKAAAQSELANTLSET
jgi:hypothetical protein